MPLSASTRPDPRWVFSLWAIAAAMLVWRNFVANADAPFFADTDDAMRMVVVRDFLAGQGWYDLIQHRLNTPFGVEIHWSRLIDLPLALLVGGLTPLLGQGGALVAAGTIWPLFLLLVLLWLSAKLTLELVGPEGLLPALAIPVLSPAIMNEFVPGRVDHHGVIIVLTLATLYLSIAALRRPLLAWAAGLFAATALGVAVEALPLVIAAILAFGLAYIADPARAASLPRFGLGFAGATAIHLILMRPPARWLEAACDMLSPVYVLAACAVGAAFLVVSLVPAPRRAAWRFALLAALGLAACLLVVLAYPQCLAGPYGELNPWLEKNWIGEIVEARPWFASLTDLPGYALAVGIPALLGSVLVLYILIRTRPQNWLGWLILLVFLVLATLVMLVQIRGARLAVMPAIPAAAWLILHARQLYLARPRPLPVLGLICSWLAFSGVALSLVVSLANNAFIAAPMAGERAEASRSARGACIAPAAFIDLAGLPHEAIMTPIDLGSHLLLETPHSSVAAPYHRNEAGVLDAFAFFNGPIAQAHDIAIRRGLALVVTCPALPEMRGLAERAPDALVDRLARNELPPWLTDVSPPNAVLKTYIILP